MKLRFGSAMELNSPRLLAYGSEWEPLESLKGPNEASLRQRHGNYLLGLDRPVALRTKV